MYHHLFLCTRAGLYCVRAALSSPGCPIRDQFEPSEQAPAADIADQWMVAESFEQQFLEAFPHPPCVLQQLLFIQHLLDRHSGCAGSSVPDAGMAVGKAGFLQRLRDLPGDHCGCQRLVAAADAFCQRGYVGSDPIMLTALGFAAKGR